MSIIRKRFFIPSIFVLFGIATWLGVTQFNDYFFGEESVRQRLDLVGKELSFSVPMIVVNGKSWDMHYASKPYKRVDQWLTEKDTLSYYSDSGDWDYYAVPIGLRFLIVEAFSVADDARKKIVLILKGEDGALFHGSELLIRLSI